MTLTAVPRCHRFPISIISQAVWIYHRFNNIYRDIEEQMAYRGFQVSYETIRSWSIKFSSHFRNVIKKRERKPSDKWHLDEMTVKVNGEIFILWRAVDCEGYELDVFLQKRRNKKAAIRFLSRLLDSYPTPRVIVTDKLKSYKKPIQAMCRGTQHRSHKGLNNRAENAHLPTRRKEKRLIKFKIPSGCAENISHYGKSS
ncbi:IS6 family transposase [Candidatus Paracaedibacter symbiosus]|uniref:IS6 family transposase n=1 Tax=Candidatus Paracaedibacter symbiosus TaxID=244582 RepID=UPI000A8C2DD0|nr:IS6 family transposase [Candidatus Paracaedibacter symbiosus]